MTRQNNRLKNIRWRWLKFIYIFTIFGAGGFGLGIILFPSVTISVLGFPGQDPVVFGVFGSVYVAFGLVSIFGLRAPLRFAPVLLLQLCYKFVWIIGVVFPILASGKRPGHALMLLIIFATYILCDIIAIPFSYIFSGEAS